MTNQEFKDLLLCISEIGEIQEEMNGETYKEFVYDNGEIDNGVYAIDFNGVINCEFRNDTIGDSGVVNGTLEITEIYTSTVTIEDFKVLDDNSIAQALTITQIKELDEVLTNLVNPV